MSNEQCSRCGSNQLISIDLKSSLSINRDKTNIPDVLDKTISYCSFCGYVPKEFIHKDGYISSKNNYNNIHDAREAHYHKTGWHFEFVTKGSFDYYERPIGSKIKPTPITVTQGQLYWVPPMVEHGLVFKEATSLLSMANKGRPEDDLVGVADDFLGTHNPGPAAYKKARAALAPSAPAPTNPSPTQMRNQRTKHGKHGKKG